MHGLLCGPEVNECVVSPRICGKGICYNLVEGYTCHCNEGHRLDTSRTTCVGKLVAPKPSLIHLPDQYNLLI